MLSHGSACKNCRGSPQFRGAILLFQEADRNSSLILGFVAPLPRRQLDQGPSRPARQRARSERGGAKRVPCRPPATNAGHSSEEPCATGSQPGNSRRLHPRSTQQSSARWIRAAGCPDGFAAMGLEIGVGVETRDRLRFRRARRRNSCLTQIFPGTKLAGRGRAHARPPRPSNAGFNSSSANTPRSCRHREQPARHGRLR